MYSNLAQFQSPRNRVKCSVQSGRLTLVQRPKCFNPLEIGSSVL